MFGLTNLGVIDQRGTPAIWQSALANFPTNNIKGRLLVDTTNNILYYDTINSNSGGMANRTILASGNFTNGDGITFVNVGDDTQINLGGVLNNDITISNNGNIFTIAGGLFQTLFLSNGIIQDAGTNAPYMPILEDALGVVTADVILNILNLATGDVYKVLAEKV